MAVQGYYYYYLSYKLAELLFYCLVQMRTRKNASFQQVKLCAILKIVSMFYNCYMSRNITITVL